MTIDLEEPPTDVADAALWAHGVPGDVAVGDLWLLSWDGQGLGLAVVSARMSGYVLVWPVSLPSEQASAPAIHLSSSPLGIPVDVWPSRETGVSDAVLHRRFGQLLLPRLMAAIGDALDEGTDPPLPYAELRTDPASWQRSEEMVDHWARVCMIQWPTARQDAPRLDPVALRATDLAPSSLVELLGLNPVQATAVMRGQISLDWAQVAAVAAHARVSPADLVQPSHSTWVTALLEPQWKAALVNLALKCRLSEGDARDRVADNLALAARSTASASERIRATIAELLNQ